ncbi:MAG: tetratricopeptide repeat protein [Terriglobia bacterium]
MAVVGSSLATTAERSRTAAHYIDDHEAAKVHFRYLNSPTPNKYLIETMGGGVALLDYDGDGWLDVFFVNGAALGNPQADTPPPDKSPPEYWNRLFRNNRDGTFSDVTEKAGVKGHGYGMGVASADYDNDGFPDLFITNYGDSILYHNNGNGTFTDVTAQAGIRTEGWNMSAGFLDYDNDGYLDLFITRYLEWNFALGKMVCGPNIPGGRAYCHPNEFKAISNYLFRNNHDGTFTDVSEPSGIKAHAGYGLGVSFGDFNNDGWPDIYVANDAFPQFLFKNNGNGTFSEEAALAGVGYTEDGNTFSGMGTDFVDLDNDGFLDILTTALPYEYFAFFHNNGNGTFEYASVTSNLAEITRQFGGWGIHAFDFDDDGGNEVFIATSHVMDNIAVTQPHLHYLQPPLLLKYRNSRFVDISSEAGNVFQQPWVARGAAFGDLDNDGDIDIVVSDYDGPAHLLRNQGGNQHHWIELDLQGTKSNRDAIGARVKLTTGEGRVQYRTVGTTGSYASSNDRRVAFGIGTETTIREIAIRWPSGTDQRIENPAPGQILRVVEMSPAPQSSSAEIPVLTVSAGNPAPGPFGVARPVESVEARNRYDSGLSLLRQGRIDEAAEAFRAAIRSDADFVDAHYALGVALSRMGKEHLPAAVDQFLEVLRLKPDHVDARVDLSFVLSQEGDSTAAAAQLERAIKVAPTNADLYILLGKAHYESNDFPKAIESFRRALELNPRLGAAHYGIGLTYSKEHDYPHAIQEFTSALQLDPGDSYSHLELGKILLDQGDPAEASRQLNEAIRLRPNSAEAHLELGRLYRRQDDSVRAETEFREALRLQPNLIAATYNLVLLLQSQGRRAEAEKLSAQVESAQQSRVALGRANALNADGIKFTNEGHLQDALVAFQRALAADPSFFMAAYNQGIVLGRLGKTQQAIAAFRTAIRLRPDFVMGHYALGLLLKSVGDPSAEEELAKARLLEQYVAQPLGRDVLRPTELK